MTLFPWNRKKAAAGPLPRAPKGAFTVDATGRVVMSTLPAAVAERVQPPLAGAIVAAFREAHAAQMSLTELNFNFPGLRVTARELRGGAIVFLTPVADGPEPTRPAA
jgi:hypothetical protein